MPFLFFLRNSSCYIAASFAGRATTVKSTIRVLAIGFSWMLTWGVVGFSAVYATTDHRSHGATSAVVAATLISAALGLLSGLIYRFVIEVSSNQDRPRRRLRSDLVLGIIVYLGLMLTLAIVAYIRKPRSSTTMNKPQLTRVAAYSFSSPYQIRTLSAGARYNVSPGFTPNAAYHGSRFLTVSARYSAGACSSVRTCCRSDASRSFEDHV